MIQSKKLSDTNNREIKIILINLTEDLLLYENSTFVTLCSLI